MRAAPLSSFCLTILVGLVALLGLAGCGKGKSKREAALDRPAPADAAPAADAAARPPRAKVELSPAKPLPAVPAGLPPPPPPPAPITAEQVALGELLFSDGRLAADGKTSCAGCHEPAAGYSGARADTALGRPNLRRALPLVNAAWQRELGWDGRFASLEEHLAAHLHGQLGAEIEAALAPVADDGILRAHFDRAFGRAPGGADAIAALAAFVRTRYAGGSRWDAEERLPAAGADPQLRAGYALFLGKAQCSVCHPPPLYTDLAYHRLGLIASPDEGRGGRGGRSDAEDRGAFKTPTLREAAARPRYFHDGSATTLADAVDWHLAGGIGQGADRSIVDPALLPVTLTAGERAQLLAFLAALTGSP